jgi:formiminoglutamase
VRPADDPNWPRAAAWLAGEHDPRPAAQLSVVGAPVRLGSISGGRFDLAPRAIREALARFSTWDGEIDVRAVAAADLGDLELAELRPEDAAEPVATAVTGALQRSDAVALLGGDNSVTRPGCRALGPDLARVGLLTLDAHHDLRETGGGLSNGNPVRALLEDGLPGWNVVQIGIQPFANSRAYAEAAEAASIGVVTVASARERGLEATAREALYRLERRVDAIYLDLDVDVLDRAFAPAAPASGPGGLTPAEVQAAARVAGAHPKVRAIDIVEVDPERDVADVTVLAATSFLLAFAAGVAARAPGTLRMTSRRPT